MNVWKTYSLNVIFWCFCSISFGQISEYNHIIDEAKQATDEQALLALLSEYQSKVDTSVYETEYVDLIKSATIFYYKNGQFQKAVNWGDRAINICDQNKYWKKSAQFQNNNGFFLKSLGNNRDALTRFDRSEELYLIAADTANSSAPLSGKGSVYENLFLLDSALIFYLQSLEIHKRFALDGKVGIILNNIGNVYFYQKDYDKALSYRQEALASARNYSDTSSIQSALNNIAGTYIQIENWDQALLYLQEAKQYINDDINKSNVYTLVRLANVQSQMQMHGEATTNLRRAVSLAEKLQIPTLLMDCYGGIGNNYKDQGNFSEALIWLQKAEKVNKIGEHHVLWSELYLSLSQVHDGMHQPDLAYAYLLKSYDLRDSIMQKDHLKITQELEAQYRNKQKQDSIIIQKARLSSAENALAAGRNWRFFLLASLFCLALLANMYRRWFLEKKAITQQQEIENEQLALENKSIAIELNETKEIVASKEFLSVRFLELKNLRIPLSDILFIESSGNTALIHTVDHTHRVYDSISILLQKLPAKYFCQIHRSYIVNMTQVESYTSSMIKLKGSPQPIPISRNKKQAVIEMLSSNT